MARKKRDVPNPSAASTGREIVTSSRNLTRIADPDRTVGDVFRDHDTTLLVGRPYVTREGTVAADEIYYVDGLGSQMNGPWLGEADKVAWRDEATGYECIMMRVTNGGYLGGYVGVPLDHPLWGWAHGAVPSDFGIEVHGGLTYSRICEQGPTPEPRIADDARRICHAARSAVRPEVTRQATDYRVEDAHAWWFGFGCDHIYDVVPIRDRHERHRYMAAETGAVYRDDAYVIREIRNLAAQLRAVADGVPPPLREGPPLPAIGLDPTRGG